MFTKVIFSSPWYFYVISLAIAMSLSYWLYYRNKKNSEVSESVIRLLFVVRFCSLTLLCFLLLNILFKHLSRETENPLILVAIDNTNSMISLEDSEFVKTTFLENLNTLKEKWAQKYEVKTLLFGSNTQNLVTPNFKDKETDIYNLLQTVENNYSNLNIGALVIVSDGIYNRGANPISISEKIGFPIYSIAMGDTTEIKDVQIQKINFNEIVYSGNNFPVEVLVRAKKLKGKEIRVKLQHKNSEIGSEVLKFKSDDVLQAISFSVAAKDAGVYKYSISLTVLDEEKNKSNNSQSFVVQVVDNKEKILVLAHAPHPDISAIKEVLTRSSNYDVDDEFFAGNYKALNSYGLVILHGYSPSQGAILKECRDKLVPYFIINPIVSRSLPGIDFSRSSPNQFDNVEPYLNPSFALFNLSPELNKFISAFPAVQVPTGFYPLSNGSIGLFKQRLGSLETENPVLFFSEVNGLKYAVFIGDGLWKWKLRDFAENKNHQIFTELLSKTTQYLVLKSDKSFFRLSAPKIISENQMLEITAEVYNKSYEFTNDSEVSLVLTNSDNKKFNYAFGKRNNGYYLNIGLLAAGEYNYEAMVKANGALYVKKGIVIVKEVQAEKINTVANHQVLYQMSKRSGGKLVYPGELQYLEETILNSELIKPIAYTQSSTIALIELKWLFAIVLFLLSIEWFFRKRFLTI